MKEKRKPAYLALYETLREEILSGTRAFGSRLPSRRSLAGGGNDLAARKLFLIAAKNWVQKWVHKKAYFSVSHFITCCQKIQGFWDFVRNYFLFLCGNSFQFKFLLSIPE